MDNFTQGIVIGMLVVFAAAVLYTALFVKYADDMRDMPDDDQDFDS